LSPVLNLFKSLPVHSTSQANSSPSIDLQGFLKPTNILIGSHSKIFTLPLLMVQSDTEADAATIFISTSLSLGIGMLTNLMF
jgi:hypothetical protein